TVTGSLPRRRLQHEIRRRLLPAAATGRGERLPAARGRASGAAGRVE
ncbi:unnamed protein product, partial [Urochloa humidicola]